MTSTMTTATPSNGPSQTYYSGMSEDSDLFKKPDIAMLNGYYLDGESCDQDVFAEMRSNVLLVAGEHYNRRQSRFYKRIRDSRELSQEQKLRLTKNHVQKVCHIFADNIISANPGVGFSPKDEQSLHDQKVTDIHHSVWRDAYERYDLEAKKDDWCDSFIQIGELHVKLFYDPSLGAVKGYEPQVDAQDGSPLYDDYGAMVADTGKPVTEGEFVFEEIYGFNLLRPPECKDLRKAEWLCVRKMSNKDELMRRFKDNPDVQTLIVTQQDETFVVFDAIRGGYKKSSKQTMIREYYFRPNMLFPEGYYYITTKEGILSEGELPGGLFPIVSAQYNKIQTTCRGRSPIKTMRPYQAEINRSASKIAEHQITLGDDKLLVQNGSKISASVTLPGIRGISYTGTAPTVLSGRSGEQYFQYASGQITELYQVMGVYEQQEKPDGQMDPYVMLFRSAKQKMKFQRHIKRFNKFLCDLAKLYLKLAKIHLPDDSLIYKIGKSEQVNIPEFRQLPDTCYETKIEEQSDDIETKLGKQIVLNHALQYLGGKMEKDDIGKILRQMPFANLDGVFDDMTIDYDVMVNDLLALDRGEQPPINQYDNHVYCIKRLVARMRKPDFQYLGPQIQHNYQSKVQLHQQFEAQQQLVLQRAQQGFIPTGGYLVGCDFYVNDPADPSGAKTRRARVPYQALDWLIKQLEAQGQDQMALQGLPPGAQAEIAGVFTRGQGAGGGQQPPGGGAPPGQPSPNPGVGNWQPSQMYQQQPMGMHPPAGGASPLAMRPGA